MGMGWLRLACSLKLCVFFAEYSLFYRALLQKRLIFVRSLLIVATPQATISTLFKTSGLHIDRGGSVKAKHSFAWELSNMQKIECMWPPISDLRLQFSVCHTDSSCAHEDVTWLIRHRHEYVTWCFFATDVNMWHDSQIPRITSNRHVHICGGYGQ